MLEIELQLLDRIGIRHGNELTAPSSRTVGEGDFMTAFRAAILLGIVAGTGCDSVMFRTGFDDVEPGILYEASELSDARRASKSS